MNRFNAFQHFFGKQMVVLDDSDECTEKTVYTMTGSGSEFYIEPIPSLVGDIDIMFHINDLLVVPKGHRFPRRTQLPEECHVTDSIQVHEMVDSKFPGYVFLRYIGLLIRCEHDNEFELKDLESDELTVYTRPALSASLGPADKVDYAIKRYSGKPVACQQTESFFSVDQVRCFRCLEWPHQAAEWPSRSRNHGWPDANIIHRVVSNGCDLVVSAHCDCKHDEWINKRMFRTSFSRAETMLLNNWTVKQQIVYHVLRYIVKKIGLTEYPGVESTAASEPGSENSKTVFSNYHFKTLMLWACERRSEQWWTQPLVRVIRRLLRAAACMLDSAECENYFIAGCNLLDGLKHVDRSQVIFCMTQLKSISDVHLSMWLNDNYIRECSEKCSSSSAKIMKNIVTCRLFDKALSLIVRWRTDNLFELSRRNCQAAMKACTREVWNNMRLRNAHLFRQQLQQIKDTDERLVPFFVALTYLHIIQLTNQQLENCKVLNIAYKLVSYSRTKGVEVNDVVPAAAGADTPSKVMSVLMKLQASETAPSGTCLLIELVKALLHVSLDADADTTVSTRVTLASLYYSSQQYHTAIGHCYSAISSALSTRSRQVVKRVFLQTTDDTIARVLGVMYLYQYLLARARSSIGEQPASRCDGVFTAELYSLYLIIQCFRKTEGDYSLTTGISSHYKESIVEKDVLLVGDILLKLLAASSASDEFERTGQVGRRYSTSQMPAPIKPASMKFNAFRLRSLMLLSAVQHLSETRRMIANDYSNDTRTYVDTDYEALYAYKCGEYNHCFQLCRQSIDELFYAIGLTPTLTIKSSDLLLLVDSDFLSVVGLLRCCVPDHNVVDDVDQRIMLFYLLIQCKLQLNHSPNSLAAVLTWTFKFIRNYRPEFVFHRLLLAFIYRKARRIRS